VAGYSQSVYDRMPDAQASATTMVRSRRHGPASSRPSTPPVVNPADAAEVLRRVIAAIEHGELTAPPLLVARTEGAINALEALTSEHQPTVEGFR
jgi:hypothetical protein